MPRPVSGQAISATERSRRHRARLAQDAADARAEAQRQMQAARDAEDQRRQAERDAWAAATAEAQRVAHVMLKAFATPLTRNSETEQEAFRRLLAWIDRWNGR